MSDQKQAELEWEFIVGGDVWSFLLEGTSQTAQLMEAEGHRLTGLGMSAKWAERPKHQGQDTEREEASEGKNPQIYTQTAPKFLANC